ncbi:MAG: lamin tail domain-containing protein [Crocinitomicaceae bacterium]|nr:lamin tail domain-containing protein [Crocinitomicaceae bacterium]
MKKTLLYFSFLVFGATYAQDCSELFISEYVEGTGNDKAIEIYNPTGATINLSGYTVERYSNGNSTTTAGGVLNLTGSIAPYSTFVIVNGQTTGTGSSPAASPALQALADQLDGAYPAPTYMNGNDAIGLFKNGVMIDLMGKAGDASIATAQSWSDAFPYDGSVGAWWTKDQTLIRKSNVKKGVSVNPDPFIVTTEWDSLPKDTWTELGQHTCDCFVGIDELASKVSFVVYPNPSQNGKIVVSASIGIEKIEILNVLGQVIASEIKNGSVLSSEIVTAAFEKGMYTVRIHFVNSEMAQSNLIIE